MDVVPAGLISSSDFCQTEIIQQEEKLFLYAFPEVQDWLTLRHIFFLQ
jgi:hypothetical protein